MFRSLLTPTWRMLSDRAACVASPVPIPVDSGTQTSLNAFGPGGRAAVCETSASLDGTCELCRVEARQ